MVPIKQNLRPLGDPVRTQKMRVTIPPSSFPDTASVPDLREADLAAQHPAPADPDALPESGGAPPADAGESGETPELPGGSKTPPTQDEESEKPTGPTLSQLRAEAHELAGKKLSYVFGADDPDSGGLDCSSTIQYLLTRIGIEGVPRTSYDQYYWLKRKKLLDDVYGKGSSSKLLKKLSPGDLIFWGGTWKSGHRVSHVMLYMGYDPAADKHYVFGARSKSVTGLTGAGVDIFELDTERGRLVAHGKVPGLVYE